MADPVHAALKHDSADKHVTGAALYVDDVPEPPRLLHIALGLSTRAHADVRTLALDAVRTAPGVALVLTAADIPGANDVSPFAADEPLLAADEVLFHGQVLFAVCADSFEHAHRAAALAQIAYDDRPAALTIAAGRQAGATIETAQAMGQGDPVTAQARAAHRLSGRLVTGGQDHFYLEGQVSLATPREDGDVHILCSTQHPSEVQHIVARILGRPDNAVTVEVRRMGGAFGGKETQAAQFAAIAALAAVKTGRPAKLRLDRDQDMIVTGKRHDFEIAYEAGFDDSGVLDGVHLEFAARCGYATDLSIAINDRAMFHADNCYALNDCAIVSQRLRTNTVSNTAFRGFGGPQGMMGIERLMDAVAIALGRDPLDVRKANLYGPTRGTITPYGQNVDEETARAIIERLEVTSDYRARRAAIHAFNAASTIVKRGIALTPVKFGISFTATHLNQAGALVHVYTDGSVHLNHGGTEMGQGLYIKVAQVVAGAFQVPLEAVKISATVTDKVPNTSATAASSGADLNGMAALNAADTILARLKAHVAAAFAAPDVTYADGVFAGGGRTMDFKAAVKSAYLARVSLSAAGFYRTPDIHYDRARHKGRPFFYYAYGAAVSEVEIDTLTGENRVLRVDILHDTGHSLNPAIDRGQIEGGFVQGMGWLTTEELVFDADGRLKTYAPSTYKIPACGDRPRNMNIAFWDQPNAAASIHRSKAVGEPPLMLAISVFSALTHAVASVADYKILPDLDAPATPERILRAVDALKGHPP